MPGGDAAALALYNAAVPHHRLLVPFPLVTRSELLALARLAGPVVIVQLGLMLMGTVDTLMLGNLSPLALSAGALGNIYSMSLLVAAQGLLMALDPLVSQAHGAGERRLAGEHLARGIVLALALTVPLTLLMLDAGPLLGLLGQPAELLPGTTIYVRAIALSNAAFVLFTVVRQTLQAMGMVRQALVAIVVGNLINLAGNRVLIFGAFGLPPLGVAGSAYSTSLARWAMLAILLASARRPLRAVWHGFGERVWALASYAQMLRLGIPIGTQVALEMWVFVTVGLIAGTIGVTSLGAHQIAINLASLSFMVPLGIGAAGATRVGNAIGAGDALGARRAAACAMVLGVAVMLVFATLFALGRWPLAGLFTPDRDLQTLAASLIAVAAVFQIFDGIQVVSLGVLRGAADTRVPAVINLVGYWLVGLPIAAWAGIHSGLGARGLWWGLTAGLASVALLLLVRVRHRFSGPLARLAPLPLRPAVRPRSAPERPEPEG